MEAACEVYISYANKDKKWGEELETHLALLQREKLITSWHKNSIPPGEKQPQTISAHLRTASIILLLLSPDYIASEECWSLELEAAIRQQESGNVLVIPILVRHTDDLSNTPLAALQPLPKDGKPLVGRRNKDETLAAIARELRMLIKSRQTSAKPVTQSSSSYSTSSKLPIWNVPFRSNPFFTGREDILSQLNEQLHKQRTTALGQPQAVSGLGGIGKTQIAVEYAYRHQEEYQAVLWVRASTSEELLTNLSILATVLNLPEQQEQDQPRIIRAVLHWLETNPRWLLIIDNADDLNMLVDNLPQRHQGHILLTTRAAATGEIATRIEVPNMPLEDGVLLLLRRAKIITIGSSIADIPGEDLQKAQQINQLLGGLPLALDQAGAYIEETGTNLADYLSLYQQQSIKLLEERGGIASDHDPVTTTWTLALEKIGQEDRRAITLMQLCAFLAPDDIPEELFVKGRKLLEAELLPDIGEKEVLNHLLAIVLKFSLLSRDRQTAMLSVHRLVQAVIKERMVVEQQEEWVGKVISLLDQIFPFDEAGPWVESQKYLGHVLVGMEYVGKLELSFDQPIGLFSKLGVYFCKRGQYIQSKLCLETALALNEQMLGNEHPNVASSLNNLANLYREQGKYEEAGPLYERALRIYEQVLGEEHPDVAGSLNNLANLYREQGKYEEAGPLYERALRIYEQVSGEEHPDVAMSLNNLAILRLVQEKYGDAGLLYEKALRIYEQMLGENHPDVASTLSNLASLYFKQGRYEEAGPLYERALRIREQMLGDEHPDVASSLNNLASLYGVQGRYEEAGSLYGRALRIYERVLGDEHPEVAISLNNMATFYEVRGKYEEAISHYQRALSIREQILGKEHPKTVNTHNALIKVQKRMQME